MGLSVPVSGARKTGTKIYGKMFVSLHLSLTRLLPLKQYPAGSNGYHSSIIWTKSLQALKSKRLRLVSDHDLFRDIGLRAAVKELLWGSYTPCWLVVGLEVVTGREFGPLYRYHKLRVFSFIDNVWFSFV